MLLTHQQLLERTALQVLRGEMELAPSVLAKAWQKMSTSIVDTVCTALAHELRKINQQIERYHLPVDLWIAIWEWLPVRDRIAVTHVSHGWRRQAVSASQLWASLDLTFRPHAYVFEVTGCDETTSAKSIIAGDRCYSCLQHLPEIEPLSITLLPQQQIAWSGSFPLTLRMTFLLSPFSHPCWRNLQRFFSILHAHGNRMLELSLRLYMDDGNVAQQLIAELGYMPNLHVFSLVHSNPCGKERENYRRSKL
ncbi:hypothetical protein BKA62DRAFT_90347 [Auriculariales sp. MPI-PUGE-AT-0066]|nr:hypothetical protein BKA62DRAFT_90347 [Auriculariales sp. MPI-PUGE-AT-0066]